MKTTPAGPLKILILGGTNFLGPHQIEYALNRGHSITIFSRGKTKPKIKKDLFKQVEHLIGDREDNLEALKGRRWDAVIDNSGFKVHWSKATAQLLKDKVDRYLYTSSVYAYYPFYNAGLTEADELLKEKPVFTEAYEDNDTGSYEYAWVKASSERVVSAEFGSERVIFVRPTIIVGPGDPLDRFMYYPIELAKDGDIFIPGERQDPVQFIDVRDVAGWMIRLIENKKTGAFNCVGPTSEMTMPAFVHGAHAAFGTKVNFIHLEKEFLKNVKFNGLTPWHPDSPKIHGFSRINNSLALENGLTITPLADTISDIHNWWFSNDVTEERRESRRRFFSIVLSPNSKQSLLRSHQNWKTKKNK